MANTIYVTGFPGPAGVLDWPTLGQFPVDVGADPVDLHAARGLAYLLRAAPPDPDTDVVLAGPPFPAGMLPWPGGFSVQWPGARPTIYPAATIGRSTAPDDVPANLAVPGALPKDPVNYGVALFDGIEPAPKGEAGFGTIALLDPAGALDYLDSLAWDGATLDLLRGQPEAPFSTYTVAARLTTAGIVSGHGRKSFLLRDLGWRLEQADIHDEIYGGTGGLDGDAAVAGQRKPYGIGQVFNVEPKLINAALAIHQLSCSSILAVDEVRDGGQPLDFDADYPTYDALAAATVPPAHYASCLAKGLIRRGSPIVYALTADFRGDADTINGQTYPDTRGQVARRIATGRGTVRLADTQIDFANLNRMEQEQPATVGFYWADGITKADALTEAMEGCLGWWAMRLNGLLAVGFIEEPTGSPALVLNYPSDLMGDPIPADAYQAPRRATFVGWRRNYTIQDASRLAGNTIDAGAGLIYGQPARYAGTTDGFQTYLWPGAGTVRIDSSGFAEEGAAYSESIRAQRIMGVRRGRWTVKTPCDPFADLLGKTIQINGYPRYGWGKARKFICVGMAFASGRAVSLDLWG